MCRLLHNGDSVEKEVNSAARFESDPYVLNRDPSVSFLAQDFMETSKFQITAFIGSVRPKCQPGLVDSYTLDPATRDSGYLAQLRLQILSIRKIWGRVACFGCAQMLLVPRTGSALRPGIRANRTAKPRWSL